MINPLRIEVKGHVFEVHPLDGWNERGLITLDGVVAGSIFYQPESYPGVPYQCSLNPFRWQGRMPVTGEAQSKTDLELYFAVQDTHPVGTQELALAAFARHVLKVLEWRAANP